MGSGGWAGGAHADTTQIGTRAQYMPAVTKGYVIVTSDHGHSLLNDGSFAMNPDGSINTVLWQDFAERSLHEMALKTKALVQAYYGKPQTFAYWDGFSTGGRQGFKLAQKYPTDFNGILAGSPAINWSRFIAGELYPQVAMQRELGAPIASGKAELRHRRGREVLRHAGAGLHPRSAAMPLRDHLWYGLTRGTNLPLSLAGTNPFPIATDQVALELQAPAYATPAFVNATGNGANKWKTLDYAGLANAYAQGLALQSSFSGINTDNPDLGAFRDVGGKVLTSSSDASVSLPLCLYPQKATYSGTGSVKASSSYSCQ